MYLGAYRRSWQIDDVERLKHALAWRDSRGGAQLWLADDAGGYPCLCICVTGAVADVHYFPDEGHPGFRCLGGDGMPEDGSSVFIFEGCDPGSGEETPNMFVVPFDTALSIAIDFFSNERMSDAVRWFEL